MKQNHNFFKTVCNLAIPVALQSMLQSSFGIVDQIMIGQLGSVNVAGVGLAVKFSGIFSVVVAALGAVAGIMISQYLGQQDRIEVTRSFFLNLYFALGLAALFTALCLLFPGRIMGFYTTDPATLAAAADYLRILSGTFFSMACATMLSALLRCMEKASLPLYASFLAAAVNTALNYLLIFGRLGFPAMGTTGAAIATVISQFLNLALMFFMALRLFHLSSLSGALSFRKVSFDWKQYASILLPILVCEFFWSLGENVYAVIYGRLGTQASAAMTLTGPIQGLMIGALCGLSQAAAVIIGKMLGNDDRDGAYRAAKKLICYGFAGSFVLSAVILLTCRYYVDIYQVEDSVKILTENILIAYALIAPFKIQNMILGGGILRSGGKTKYVMFIDLIGTWVFGVPLGLLAAFVLKLPVPAVYFILSLEECVRFAISIVIFRKKGWMTVLRSAEMTDPCG